mmetsp:Transcript_33902/g.85809  ORF Transcript_33902/g.85809 Transcript_33902/m.85809 type:complete len:95 (+) Transcript_33902:94-378(+)
MNAGGSVLIACMLNRTCHLPQCCMGSMAMDIMPLHVQHRPATSSKCHDCPAGLNFWPGLLAATVQSPSPANAPKRPVSTKSLAAAAGLPRQCSP